MVTCMFLDLIMFKAEGKLNNGTNAEPCLTTENNRPSLRTNLDKFKPVAFWVTNPCRITRKVKQTKMYVCTLEEFILVDLDTLLCKLELICIGKCCSLYTIATMDEKCENCS